MCKARVASLIWTIKAYWPLHCLYIRQCGSVGLVQITQNSTKLYISVFLYTIFLLKSCSGSIWIYIFVVYHLYHHNHNIFLIFVLLSKMFTRNVFYQWLNMWSIPLIWLSYDQYFTELLNEMGQINMLRSSLYSLLFSKRFIFAWRNQMEVKKVTCKFLSLGLLIGSCNEQLK